MKINKQILKESLLKLINEDFKNPTDLGTKITDIGNDIRLKNNPKSHSGQDLYSYEKEFIQALKKNRINKVSKEVINDLIDNNEHTVVKLLQRNHLVKESKQRINESINSQWIYALKEIIDDLQMQTEMLIDKQWGKDDLKSFKEKWYKITIQFDKQFGNMLKNLKR